MTQDRQQGKFGYLDLSGWVPREDSGHPQCAWGGSRSSCHGPEFRSRREVGSFGSLWTSPLGSTSDTWQWVGLLGEPGSELQLSLYLPWARNRPPHRVSGDLAGNDLEGHRHSGAPGVDRKTCWTLWPGPGHPGQPRCSLLHFTDFPCLEVGIRFIRPLSIQCF